MKVLIFGCRKIAFDAINHISDNYKNSCEIVGVVTHDAERDRVYNDVLVSEHCDNLGIPWVRFDGKIQKDVIEKFNPDIIFSLYYRKILKQEILDIPEMGCINIHPALLPKGRGPAPSLWNVLNGDEYAGTTIHYMVEGVDAGDIIDQKKVRIGEMTGYDLNVCLGELGFELFKDNFEAIISGENKRTPQNHAEATYCIPFAKNLRYLYWDDPDLVLRRFKTFTKPYDGAIAYVKGKFKLLAWEGKKLSERKSLKPPGFYELTEDGILVQTGALPVLVTDWDILEGKFKNKGRFNFGPPLGEDIC